METSLKMDSRICFIGHHTAQDNWLHNREAAPAHPEKTMEELRAWLAARHSRAWLEICLTNHALALAVKSARGSWRRWHRR